MVDRKFFYSICKGPPHVIPTEVLGADGVVNNMGGDNSGDLDHSPDDQVAAEFMEMGDHELEEEHDEGELAKGRDENEAEELEKYRNFLLGNLHDRGCPEIQAIFFHSLRLLQ